MGDPVGGGLATLPALDCLDVFHICIRGKTRQTEAIFPDLYLLFSSLGRSFYPKCL